MAPQGQDFRAIRSWDGSQDRAFEELCYQLRDPVPDRAILWKLGNPDGGYEWFVRHPNGIEWGWQAKYTFEIDSALKLMEASLRAVVRKRPRCRRLTFCIPFDLPDSPGDGERKSARQKFEDRKKAWRRRIPGASNVRIDLWQAGDLLERLARPEHRGIVWFFWDEEVFGPDWCRRRLEVTVKAAGDRYTPALNVELPVAFALEGLARSQSFYDRYRRRRGEFVKASRRVVNGHYTGLGVTKELRDLAKALRRCESALPRTGTADRGFPRREMLDVTLSCRQLLWRAHPDRRRSDTTSGTDRRAYLQHELGVLSRRLNDLLEFLQSSSARAAELGVLLMTGDAGQGKTHLFCDAGGRAADAGQPAVVLLGQGFSGSGVFTELAERLGLPPRGATELLGAMRAAGEASGRPFVVLIDALNDSGDPQGWQQELPLLLAETSQYFPWVVVGVSIRSSYVDLISSGATDSMPTVEHPGFTGYEYDAAQRFFSTYELEQPRIPLLLPEFSNPLFLRMYCEGLSASDSPAPEVGHAHISEVFDRYLATKNRIISRELRLDPATNSVGAAVESLAHAAIGRGHEWLPREAARALVDAHAPSRDQWPNTLFGRLLAEGVLTDDVAYSRMEDGDWELIPTTQITFQRFADYRIATSMVAPFKTAKELEVGLAVGQPLRAQLAEARTGLIEALAVLLPERFGVELLDAARWNLRGHRAARWHQATLASIASRRDDAVSQRTAELLREISGRSRALFDAATETLCVVAARPDHPLNAEFLHASLSRMSMPDRDAAWGIATYGGVEERGPMDRIVRWAAAGPYPDYPDRVIELASIPLVWALSSPNRIMRDYVTKVLCRLLAQRLPVVRELLDRFRSVNDPYVLQRMAVAAHGAVLVGGPSDRASALDCAKRLADIALDTSTLPDFLTRDAARGALEWCLRSELIDAEEYERSCPPYLSAIPQRPRTKRQLENAYSYYRGDPVRPGYSQIWSSVTDYGDFGRYVIESKVRHFTRYRLERPLPPRRRPASPKVDAAKLAELEATLAPQQLALAQEGDWESFARDLSPEQELLLSSALHPHVPYRSRSYPSELAQRWVFERVLDLGWTPDRFDDFDSNYGYQAAAARSGHKPERFGKKYQWIALRELVARISDNFHMGEDWGDDVALYAGPWQFNGRDIDPTLPPAPRLQDEDGSMIFGPTYQPDRETAWWVPSGPRYSGEQPPAQAGWAESEADIPDMRALVSSRDRAGARWIALHAYYNWDEQPSDDQERNDRPRRDMWSHIYSWLVARGDTRRLFDIVNTKSLMNRWMPQGHEITDAAYIPEMPWAAAAHEYAQQWEPVVLPGHQDDTDVTAYATWSEYYWEGNVWDCSMDEGVRVMVPSEALYEAGRLEWVPGKREWTDVSGNVVVTHRETEADRRSVLLVREDWLKRVLADEGWSLVVGWLGEKQLFGAGFNGGLLGGWSEINGAAMYHRGRWTFGPRRISVRQPAR